MPKTPQLKLPKNFGQKRALILPDTAIKVSYSPKMKVLN